MNLWYVYCCRHVSYFCALSWTHRYEILYYDADTGRQLIGEQRHCSWHTWSCVLGFPVMGIFPSNMDGTHINACHRSYSGKLLVTADDFGLVRLLNFPAVVCAFCNVCNNHASELSCTPVSVSAFDWWLLSAHSFLEDIPFNWSRLLVWGRSWGTTLSYYNHDSARYSGIERDVWVGIQWACICQTFMRISGAHLSMES